MRVLITSGGGAKGAFSVGALQYLQQNNLADFDFISGTSTGSLIACMTAAGRIDVLTDVYLNTTNADILDPQNLLDGRPYLYDTDPLLKQIDTHLTPAAFDTILQWPGTVCYNAVCLQTGKLTVFSTRPLAADRHYDQQVINSRQMMIDGMLGSTNQAVFMKPVIPHHDPGMQYVDGGNREVIPTRVVINNLSRNEDHEIYVLSNNPTELLQVNRTFTNILDVLMRAISIFIQEVRENDLNVLSMYKKISPTNIRIFYICPDRELDTEFPTGLNFEFTEMEKWMQMGAQTAKQVITNNPNGNFS
ncbi:patatin-like phospholipase family protein [Chitinophaga solisilvae]|uniref:Patatin-like phospholipase family protein n=1 Tax=Chitinophaga solisilvae TaxID=1233460 RepID=A0A3S1D424_9BACT|nr:patatin-like phospholipase family protein [Chitinophaga solisilvae]NSL87689.1 patatin-like phospholipase family protein [Chitinophaga solisilvae]